MDAIPQDIRNLPTYVVSSQLFASILAIISALLMIFWGYVTYFKIFNTDYVVDIDIILEQKKYASNSQQGKQLASNSQSSTPKYSEKQWIVYNRIQNRFLQFLCLVVVVVININSFTALAMQVICFGVSIILFIVFNLIRVADKNSIMRVLFMLPIIGCYLPFYIFNKSLGTK